MNSCVENSWVHHSCLHNRCLHHRDMITTYTFHWSIGTCQLSTCVPLLSHDNNNNNWEALCSDNNNNNNETLYGQILAVLLFFISVLNLLLFVYVSCSSLNLVSPAAELYSRYDGVPNLPFYLERNVEFESHSSVGVARLFIVISPSWFGRCDKRLCSPLVSLFTNRAVAVQFVQCWSWCCCLLEVLK